MRSAMGFRLTSTNIIKHQAVQNLRCAASQEQLFGVYLTLNWISPPQSTKHEAENCAF